MEVGDAEIGAGSASMAAKLIGVRAQPPGLASIMDLAGEARAYNVCDPYPLWYFRDWKIEDRGPLPRCLPLARSIVHRGAKWLFGRSPALTCAGNTKFEELIGKAWKAEKMPARLVAMARRAGVEGGVALKFAYDSTRKPQPLAIMALSLMDEVRLYMDPHDCERMLMARVQYRYFDASQNETFWYREEWTEAEEVHYEPIKDEQLGSGTIMQDPDLFEGWEISSRAANPLGVIPIALIKNFETDDLWGAGDCWDLFRVNDRINLTYHLMDKSNQFDSTSTNIFLDVDVDETDIATPLAPGGSLQLRSSNVDGEARQQGKVIPIEPRGSLRPAMMEYAKDLRRQLLAAASSVEVDQSEISNKGNLTTAVLQQIYQPLIEITEEKRKTWQDGLMSFFAKIGTGLQNVGVPLGIDADDDSTYEVSLAWRTYFEPSQDEKTAMVTRTQVEETAGYLTHERAIDRVAQVEGVDDVPALKEELAKEPPPAPVQPIDPDLKTEETELQDLRRIGGKDSL